MSEAAENSPARCFETEVCGDIVVIRFDHDTFDRPAIECARDQLRRVVDETPLTRFIVDFSKVTYMSSMILGVVMGLHLKICRRQGQLRISGLRAHILEVFLVMRLDRILRLIPTVDEAKSSFD